MSDDIEIKFGADASGAVAGAEEAGTSVKTFAQLVAESTVGLQAMGAKGVESLHEIAIASKETAEQLRGVAETVTEMREVVTGLGEAFLAALAIEQLTEFAKKMGETAEQNVHTAETFGTTAAEIQKLNGEAAALGISSDAITRGMQRADNALTKAREGSEQQAQAFQRLGVNIKEAMSNPELFDKISEGLAKIQDPTTRVGLAMQVFGRNIQGLAPLLNVNDEQMKEIQETLEKYGVVSDDATAKGLALAEQFNTNAVAGMGVSNIMTSELAPAFAEAVKGVNDLTAAFVESFKTGGAARGAMDALVFSVKAVIDGVGALGVVVDLTWKGIEGASWVLAGVLAPVFDGVIGGFNTVIVAAQGFGKVMQDVLTLNWGAIQGDIQAAMKKVADAVTQTATLMGKEAAEGFKKGIGELASTASDVDAYAQFEKKLWGAWQGNTAGLPKAGTPTGNGGVTPNPKENKDKSAVPALEANFDSQEADKEMSGMLVNKEADALAYWSFIRDNANLSGEERIAVEKKVAEATLAVNQQNTTDFLSAQSAETAAANAAVEAQLAATKQKIQGEITAEEDLANKKVITRQTALSRIMGLIAQEVAAEKDAATTIYLNRINLDAEIMSKNEENTSAYKRAYEDQAVAYQALQTAMTKADADGNNQRQKADQAYINASVTAFNQMATKIGDQWRTTTEGLIEVTTTWQQVWNKMLNQMLDWFLRQVETMVIQWGAGETAKSAATVTGTQARTAAEQTSSLETMALAVINATKQIIAFAATAAAGAFAALAGIPIVGPGLGAAAAASAESAVYGFANFAEKGWGDVPDDNMPTLLHKREMVLPAEFATPLRGMLSGMNAPSANLARAAASPLSAVSNAYAGGGGDTNHFHIHAMDAQSVQSFFNEHSDKLAKSLERARRNGAFARV